MLVALLHSLALGGLVARLRLRARGREGRQARGECVVGGGTTAGELCSGFLALQPGSRPAPQARPAPSGRPPT